MVKLKGVHKVGMSGRLTALPADNREVVRAGRPIKTHRLLVEPLQFHCELTLFDFILREDLKVGSKAEELHGCDEPLGGVILIPLDGIAVIHWELVMEIMVTLSEGDECGEHVIARSVLVVEGSLTKPVSERVDTEGRLGTKGESTVPAVGSGLTWWTKSKRVSAA
jgi:hypothetical protein